MDDSMYADGSTHGYINRNIHGGRLSNDNPHMTSPSVKVKAGLIHKYVLDAGQHLQPS